MRKKTGGRIFAVMALCFSSLGVLTGVDGAGAAVILTADPTSLDLGETRIADQAVDIITLTNDSDADEDIVIGDIVNEGGNVDDFAGITGFDPETGDPDFAHDCLVEPDGESDRVLAPGESCTMFIIGQPSGRGTRSTTMAVKDPSDETILGVFLSMTGTDGYLIAGVDGGVAKFGDANLPEPPDPADASGLPLEAPIIDIQHVPFGNTGTGFWLTALDGGVFNYGDDAEFLGSAANLPLNAPIWGMAARSRQG